MTPAPTRAHRGAIALTGGARGGTWARHNNNREFPRGRYHVFHMDDIRRIAPKWFEWEKVIRMNPQLYWSLKDPKTGERMSHCASCLYPRVDSAAVERSSDPPA